ncbi:MAG: glycosyltransferase [Lachnospiraceae bacterium]|nr:glycosyltransferase [Lachnospiraceae bacterium]
MEREVKVSVMILAYNHENYIRQALESVVGQRTNFRFEAVVGEDCSTDGTREIVREYARKYPDVVKPLFRKKNLGACRNVVSTLRRCRGEYVAFLECDDYWTDMEKLQKQADYLDAHPECAGVMTRVAVVDRYGREMVTGPKLLDHALETPRDFAKTMYPYNQFKFVGCFMARNYYGGGAYDPYLLQTEMVDDFIVEAIAVSKGKIAMLDEIMAAYRWVPAHGGNFSAMKPEFLCRDRIKSLKTVIQLFPVGAYPRIYMRICRDYWQLLHKTTDDGAYGKWLKIICREMNCVERAFYLAYYVRRKLTGVF